MHTAAFAPDMAAAINTATVDIISFVFFILLPFFCYKKTAKELAVGC
jgi:hypothetical protein